MNDEWIDRHSVNCYDCGSIVDERDCVDGDEYTKDGGSLCQQCLERRLRMQETQKKLAEVRRQLEENSRLMAPLENQRWRLIDKEAKLEVQAFVESDVLRRTHWSLIMYRFGEIVLRYEGEKKPEFEEVVPYPHSDMTLRDGVVLRQDDGVITMAFDSAIRCMWCIRKWDLQVDYCENEIRRTLARSKAVLSLCKFLSSREKEKENVC